MGIIKWRNDRKSKPTEAAQEITKEKTEPVLSDVDRITNYFAKGGEIVSISKDNEQRRLNDGFAPDGELLHPWNEAHRGMKDGLMRGGRR
jgi:hypothetical protein